MNCCLPQEFLRHGGTLKQLTEKYGIKVKEAGRLALLKYDQVASPMGDRLVQQCRGLILEKGTWDIVSWPFDKFFNYGEGHAAAIDWLTARVQEKLDGSLMQMYFYDGAWRVGSSGTPDASGQCYDNGFTFADLFWKTFEAKGWYLPSEWRQDVTFLFELMSPYNRIVVRHPKPDLKLIGARNRVTGLEYRLKQGTDDLGWEAVREFSLQSMKDIEATFEYLNPLQQEGYVVVDAGFNRVKVKHPGYVAIHHMRGEGAGPKRILEVIRAGESSELLTHFPEWKPDFDRIQAAFDGLLSELERDYGTAAAKTDAALPQGVVVQPSWSRKEFASHAVKSRVSGALFSFRDGKVASIRESLAKMNLKHLMTILGVKDGGDEV